MGRDVCVLARHNRGYQDGQGEMQVMPQILKEQIKRLMRSFHRNITIEEYNKRVKVKDQEIAFLQTENYALKNELRIKGAADEAV